MNPCMNPPAYIDHQCKGCWHVKECICSLRMIDENGKKVKKEKKREKIVEYDIDI